MMANKKLKLNEIIVENIDNEYELRRDSFSDRFCDDLLEVILNYLSIEEKIRFESISKQWKKLIFNKQKSLEIDVKNEGKNNLFKLLKVFGFHQNIFKSGNPTKIYKIENKTFVNVLKKFKYLNHLSLGNIDLKNKNEVLNAVTDNCDYLKTIKISFHDINKQTLNKMSLKFGQQLKNIYFSYLMCNINSNLKFFPTNKKSIIKMFPKLSVIIDVKIEDLIDKNEVLVKSVTKLLMSSIGLHSKENVLLNFKLFSENNCNSIESLQISAHFKNSDERTDFLKQISVMKKLKALNIFSPDCEHYSKSFIDGMKSIADNCKQLNVLLFTVFRKKSFDIKHAFESFANFKTLKKLSFSTIFSQTADEYRIDCLKNCKLLTHLSLHSLRINDDFFVGIDSIVPQLKQLIIRTKEEISDKALVSISKLKHLERLVLYRIQCINTFELNLITDLGLISLIKNCQNLKSIKINKRPNITHKTIDALKEKALKNPRIYFNHYFESFNEESDGFTAIDPKSLDSLPINLKIRS